MPLLQFLENLGKSVVQGVANPIAKGLNEAQAGVAETRALAGALTNNPTATQNAQQAAQSYLQPGGGLLHQGGVLQGGELTNQPVFMGSNAGQNIRATASEGLQLGSLAAGPEVGAAANAPGEGLAMNFLRGAAANAAFSTATGGAQQLLDTGKINPSSLASNAALGGVLGGAGGAVEQLKFLSKLSKTDDVTKVTKQLQPHVGPLVADEIAPAIAKADDPNVIRNIIQNAVGAKLTPLNEVGAVGTNVNPNTPEAQAPVTPPENPSQPSPEPISDVVENPPQPGPPVHNQVEIPNNIENPDIRAALQNTSKPTDVGDLFVQPGVTSNKQAGTNIRTAYSGEENRQIAAGLQLRDTLNKVAPDEQDAIFWYRDQGGDAAKLQALANNPNPKLDPYRADIEKAMTLSPQAKEASAALDHYYNQAGANALDQGSIKGILNDYGNKRLYIQDNQPGGTGDTVKTTTGMAKQRSYNTVADAVLNGKIPASTNAADVMAIHGAELARVNTGRNLLETMRQTGIGDWVDPNKMPSGFQQVGNLRNGSQVFAAPQELADKLRAITDPGKLGQIEKWRSLGKYQGLVKTVDLSYSLFHHLSLGAQMLYQSKGGLDIIKNLPKIMSVNDPEFAGMEQQFLKDGGITTKVGDVQDIMRGLVGAPEDKSVPSLVSNLPGIKQALGLSQKSTSFLFDTAQRWMKVTDYQNKMAGWLASHSAATDEEVAMAGRGYAKEINSAYGGLNWQALGIGKDGQRVLRSILLAPDWTLSNVQLGKAALGGGTGGVAARSYLFTAALTSLVASEAMNKGLTGHFTNENPQGHQLEVQIAPGTYVNLFRGPIGDIVKLGSDVAQSGVGTGIGRFAEGKLAPLPRTAVGLGTNVNYFGQQIAKPTDSTLQKTVNSAKFVGESALPIPFGVTGAAKQAGAEGITPATALTAAGIARYSPTNIPTANQTYVTEAQQVGASKQQVNAMTSFFGILKNNSTARTAATQEAVTDLAHGDSAGAQQAIVKYNQKLMKSLAPWQSKNAKYMDNTMYAQLTQNFSSPYTSQGVGLLKLPSASTVKKDVQSNPTKYNLAISGGTVVQ